MPHWLLIRCMVQRCLPRFPLRLLAVALLLSSASSWALTVESVPEAALLSWPLAISLFIIVLLLSALVYLWLLNRRLLHSKHKLSIIWQHIPDVLTEVNEEGDICALNQPLSEDLPVEKVVGTNSYQYLNEADQEVFRQHLKLALSSGQEQQYELSAHLPDRVTYLSNRIVRFYDPGEEAKALVITTDISHHKEAQTILQQARQQAEDNAQAKSRFLATMSHEIRTPLSGIVGMVSLMEDSLSKQGQQDHEFQQFTGPLMSSVQHLRQIVDDVLDLSRTDSGQIELDPSPTNLWQILDDLEALYLPQAMEKHVHLSVSLAAQTPRLFTVDGFRLRQIMYNLLNNALKFTEQGSVSVRITPQDLGEQQVLKFSVKDTGIGISESDQQVIFDVFRQASGSITRTHGGSGLGLSICRNLIEIMGGIMGVESALGKGSEFWFTLPLNDAQQPQCSELSQMSVCLAIEDSGKHAWFSQFFHGLGIAFSQQKNSDDFNGQLWVSDHINHEQVSHQWWLGPDYQVEQNNSVTLALPFRREALRQRLLDIVQDSLPQDNEAQQQAEPGHILLVEDNLTNQLVIRRTLEKMGYTVAVANNGQEGLNLFQQSSFALVVMDIQMPVMDGIESTRRIRQLSGIYVPIVALTANTQPEIEEACFAAGMDAFLNKPVNQQELQTTLQAVLGKDMYSRHSSV